MRWWMHICEIRPDVPQRYAWREGVYLVCRVVSYRAVPWCVETVSATRYTRCAPMSSKFRQLDYLVGFTWAHAAVRMLTYLVPGIAL